MLGLKSVGFNEFDLVYDNASDDEQSIFATLVYALIFTDSEADSHYVADRYERRGWWYEPKAGSLVWALRQQPLNAATRSAVLDNVRAALSVPALSGVVVTDATPPNAVSAMVLSIAATYKNTNLTIQVSL